MFNKTIAAMLPYMPQSFVWIFSKRYVAGKTLEEAIQYCKDLNAQGIKITIDVLGEFIKNMDEAEQNKKEYLHVIETIEKSKIMGNYSLKPTMFGLLLDKEACYKHIREIVAKAAEYNNFVRVDMEDTPCTDMEIELFRKLKKEFPKNVGLVIQAYLKRTLQDVTNLLDVNTPEIPMNFRLCKGIYNESKELAYKLYEEINQHYLEDLEFMLKNKIFVGIATHDKPLVDGAYKLIEKYNVPKNMYEFQMLLGVTPELRKSILDNGHNMRVYVPYGTKWFAYCTRRLKENPKMAGMIIKALFKRG
ncbi:MAG: proline dehydrogenase family protein [Bacteroidales bacterium]|jgi:proline dehydrogenase